MQSFNRKNYGCIHTKCNCGYNWCCFCKKQFENQIEHFGINGPCPFLQFTRKESHNNCNYLCIHNTWIIVMHHILLLFIFTSISATYSLRKSRNNKNFFLLNLILIFFPNCIKLVDIKSSVSTFNVFLFLFIFFCDCLIFSFTILDIFSS